MEHLRDTFSLHSDRINKMRILYQYETQIEPVPVRIYDE